MRATIFVLLLSVLVLAACSTEEATDPEVTYTWQFALLSPEYPVDAAVNRPYDQTFTYSVTGVGPYTWTITAGTVPTGMTLENSSTNQCRLYGTPSQTGVYAFRLEIDSDVGPVTFDRVVRVYPAGSLLVTTVQLGPGAAGMNYGVNVEAVGGSEVGYSWVVESGSLPPGLALDHRDITLNWGTFSQTGTVDQSLGSEKLTQVSGLVASRSQPGVFWMHDDTVAGPFLFAVDAAGNVLQQYQLQTSRVDWEDIAIGPGTGLDYIYLGDFGDDTLSRTDCRIVRVVEPAVPMSPTQVQPLTTEEFWFTYPAGAQNCETLLFDRGTGTPYLIERTAGTPRVHKFPMPLDTAWNAANPVTLIDVPVTGTIDASITSGDASRDARRMILRNSTGAREYARPAGASFDEIFNQAGTPITAPAGQAFEAIAYGGDGADIWTTTEIAGQTTVPVHSSGAAPDNGYTTISGVPTTPGQYAFTLRVTDSAGNEARRTFVIVVN